MHHPTLIVIGLSSSLALAVAGAAPAGLLAAAWPQSPNGQATDAWSSSGSYVAGQTIAAAFTLERSVRVERFTVWGASSALSIPGLDNVTAAEVLLWNADFSAAVAAATYGVADLTATPTGETTDSGGIQYQISGLIDLLLPAGTYHLNVGAVLVDGGSDPFLWSVSDGGSLWVNAFDGAGWIEDADVPTPAFALEGAVLLADLDGDGQIGGSDLGLLLANWGACAECGSCLADLDGDCQVDGADLGALLAAWSTP